MTPDQLPPPLTSADIDLSGMPGFMLDTERLMASELWAVSSGEEFKAAVALWCRAWKQKPPASLPNDERMLASFSGAGSRWGRVRKVALRGFVLCSDGRLYHRVLSADAQRAWSTRVAYRDRAMKGAEGRWGRPRQCLSIAQAVPDDAQEKVKEKVKEKPHASSPSHAGQGAAPPAAASLTRVPPIDKAEAFKAMGEGDLCRLLKAFACTVDGPTKTEWPGGEVTGGQTLHEIATVLFWRICLKDQVRMPSGNRKARVQFQAQPLAERQALVMDCCEYLGIACPAMKAPTAPDRIAS